MATKILTGFHAVEERIKRAGEAEGGSQGISLYVSNPGPRIKKIISFAKDAGVSAVLSTSEDLDALVKNLPEMERDHRGVVLVIEGETQKDQNYIDFGHWIEAVKNNTVDSKRPEHFTVLILDSVTDPHNVGAIIRSSDQFGVDLVILPERHGNSNVSTNDIIARSSAGASAWVPVAVVTNLVRSVQQLKEAGFWVYGADAGGDAVQNVDFADKTAIIMGSEGNGIGHLLGEQCDTIVSIPTFGRIDSLNVSVAAGVLLYERSRRMSV